MIARLRAWWQRLLPGNEADMAYLSAHRDKAERLAVASRARTKRIERQLARPVNRNPVAEMLRGEWPEERRR